MKNFGHKLGVITAMALVATLPDRKLNKEFLESEIENVEFNYLSRTITHCTIHTKSGFTFTGESVCVDPSNFNKEVGEVIAYENAFEEMWLPYGFWLHKALVEHNEAGSKDWLDRVCEELAELTERKEKLEQFISGDKPDFVSDGQWKLMQEQFIAMNSYRNILLERLDEANGVVSGIRLFEKGEDV